MVTDDNAKRASLIWPILTTLAAEGSRITYSDLADRMGRQGLTRHLGKPLGLTADYCSDNELPRLNVIVVSKTTGEPSKTPGVDADKVDAEQRKVFGYDWSATPPPKPGDFIG